ncbi:unnamed protein product [Fusarium venenatum]|uniref:Uncharacterized protein n=1 Tax=Fusarium venenatum TaxID=56646 RepID=A0A2L2TJM3_9HYPO|nr:uncharacterized protein FVRRES_13248 [Fusarium venenatum]CEI40729.1 unnamed protein product [Fusarium venenatum]
MRLRLRKSYISHLAGYVTGYQALSEWTQEPQCPARVNSLKILNHYVVIHIDIGLISYPGPTCFSTNEELFRMT